MSHLFWLTDIQFERLRPLLPNKMRGVKRVDDRRVISGIIHVIRNGLMWRDAPTRYGPAKTLYNRFIRWSRAGIFNEIFAILAAKSEASEVVMIDATHLKAHRTAASLLKKGLFPAVSGARKAGSTQSFTRSVIVKASH
jgi:putative transposase